MATQSLDQAQRLAQSHLQHKGIDRHGLMRAPLLGPPSASTRSNP
jgi:hypothetical protein